jgi:O-acetyl-ADP-ribose deacetylase (regulator of RNase III)
MKIRYLKGDATEPVVRPAIIVHVCNDVGVWGAGFVIALSRKWSQPEKLYRRWFLEKRIGTGQQFALGRTQYVSVEPDIQVANMIAQTGLGTRNGIIPLRYNALKECLKSVYMHLDKERETVHMPRIGCGLAGGDWNEVEKIINEVMTCDTYVYDLK